MALSPGTKIGSFEITGSIGAGGMGEVYRATDMNLGRQVAIKVLPDMLAQDTDRLARFDREAKALASLNHPNIAAIYGLEKSDGQTALVMELVEGPTLADRIVEGPIQVDEALTIARQIAEALEAAHEQGIVHRDLKPANIKVRPDGTVKVLDFGLAKAIESSSASEQSIRGADLVGLITQSPTIATPAMTRVGIILGTAAYMSPEQARGKPVDRRADIWAFGCVLFEMLTGTQAFHGEDVSEIVAHILTREPDWAALPGTLSPRALDLLRLCLQRDVKKRRRDAGDLVLDIDRIVSEPLAPLASAAAPRSARLGWIAAAVFAAIAIGAIAFAMRPVPAVGEMRLSMTVPTTGASEFAVSPDGTRVVVAGIRGGTVWIRRLDRTDAQAIAVNSGTRLPFWSADGRFVCYWSAGMLWRIDPAGGPPSVIAETSSAFSGATVNSDGTIVFAESLTSPLYRVSGVGGQRVQITHLDAPHAYGHMQPRFLPDGRHFLFFATGGSDAQGVYLASLDSDGAKRLTPADAHGEFLEPGYVAYVSRGALMARKLDLDRGELTGDAQVIADGVAYTAATGFGAFSVSPKGQIAYRSSAADRRRLTWYDRATNRSTPAADPDSNGLEAAELSPDGRHVALDRIGQGNRDIWLLDLTSGSVPRFTFDPAQDGMPVWSPDSKRIAYESKRKGPYDLYVKAVDGADVERPLLETPYDKWPMDWSRDGAYVLYYETRPKTSGDLEALPMTGRGGGDKIIPVATTSFDEIFGQFSPDGRWVAYQTDESGRPEVVVQSFPDPSIRRQLSRDGALQPRWSRDGKELYFVSLDSKLMAAKLVISAGSVEPAAVAALFPVRLSGVPKHQYSVAADGRFLVNEVVEDSASSLLTFVLNWTPK
jgi:eukaryotic-like serine/threonine-protein kinase